VKAQIHGPCEVYDFIVSLDSEESNREVVRDRIWLPDEELVDLTDDEVALVLQYREIAEKYYKLCEAKKAEQDAKGM
jgi:hypothetical protein